MEKYSETKITVRYCETDKMGIVHHSRYYPWFEVSRDDFIKRFGIGYGDIEKNGLLMPLIETGAKYFKPAHYGDTVTVRCAIKKISASRCFFEYEVLSENGDTLCTGITVHAFCNADMKPVNVIKKFPDIYKILAGEAECCI